MGLIRRNKSGKLIGGSKLNVPGQGVYTVVRQPNDKLIIGPKVEPPYVAPEPTPKQKDKIPIAPTPTITLTPTPTPTITLTPTPTPTITLTPTPTPTITLTPTPTPTITLTPTPTITLTPTPTITLTPTPSITPTLTITPTPTITPSSTPIEICYLATEDLNPIIAENLDNLIVDCPEPAPEIIDAILIDGGSEYLIPGSGEYLSFVDP